MSDPRNVIQSMFKEADRYANFGDLLMRMRIQGFRCHSDTIVDIESPITAFCGLNGTGKSTLLQLAASAYKSSDLNLKPYYIKDFLVVGTLDPSPFASTAAVEFKYWQANRSLKTVTLTRNDLTKRWRGYKRRPERRVLFAGIGLYLPKIEQRDFIVRHARELAVSSSIEVAEQIRVWTSRVLGYGYDSVISNTVTYSGRTGEAVSVERWGVTYSEAHMGYGEGRGQYLVSTLETLPEKSLVLIEEPETSLHPSAQYQFGQYLVDVVKRKRHQVLLSTHSEFILKALPSRSIAYLKRTADAIDVIRGLTPLQAKSLMSEGYEKALVILVEDECAKAVLCEIVRRASPEFLRSVGIYAAGDSDTIGRTIRSLEATGLSVAAVRDADMGDEPSRNIFNLPGSQAPEKEIFGCEAIKDHLHATYGVNLDDFVAASLGDADHHEWLERLAHHVSQNASALTVELARVYAQSLSEAQVAALVDPLKEAPKG